jgi:carotenoid cleavage dioxygenase-like enzyme
MSTESQPNPFLSGNFAPVLNEDVFADLPVAGEVPQALAGEFPRFDERRAGLPYRHVSP